MARRIRWIVLGAGGRALHPSRSASVAAVLCSPRPWSLALKPAGGPAGCAWSFLTFRSPFRFYEPGPHPGVIAATSAACRATCMASRACR